MNEIKCEDFYKQKYMEDWKHTIEIGHFKKSGVKDFCEKNPDFTEEEVWAHIAEDPMFARNFYVSPDNQSCYEHYACEFINTYSIADTSLGKCESLPNGGPNALFVYNGRLVSELPQGHTKDVKSIDFKITYKNFIIYASHKHTAKYGGNQDNQWKDLQIFAKHAYQNTIPNIKFIAIGDGPYYQREVKGEDCTKLGYINKNYQNESFCALTTDDIKSYLESLE